VPLHHMFVRMAKTRGRAVAIVDRATNQRVTYKDALLRSLILADKLKKYEEGFIGVMIPTSAGCIYTMVAALMTGRVPVMINYSTGAAANCAMAQRRLAFRTIITSRALVEKIKCPKVEGMVFIEDLAASVSTFDKVRGLMRSSLSADRICHAIHAGNDDDNAVILFTSGSETDPKAVPLTHRNVSSNIEGMAAVLDYGPDDVMLGNLPLFHVFGLTVNLWLPISAGMRVVTYANPLEFRAICNIIRDERATMVVGTPAFLAGYLHKSEPGDFASIRLLITGADKCPEALRQGFLERHGLVLIEGYGATETSPVITVNTPAHNRPGSVGRTLPNVQLLVEHYDTGEPCGVKEIGKILVKGPSVMKAYFDDFETTALHIRHGWYDTGDMGYMDEDGYLWHIGRLRRFLKIGGEMVSLVKVEDILERLVPPGVLCAVVEVPDALRGARIVAAVTQQVDEKAILKQMAAELPRIALPRQFVTLPDLPKMSSGKLDFRAITEVVRDIVQAPHGAM
jgi:acyl-[acyl-carrier-protein]-phospholipid O-acyltransferase/long-chain-fatty-acid--[acyl-carrier-protein] ligase